MGYMGWLLCCKGISFQLLKGKINHVSGTAKKKKENFKTKKISILWDGKRMRTLSHTWF